MTLNLTFQQSTGTITTDDGSILVPSGSCWAGRGEGKDNPAMEAVHYVGPLPAGTYSIGAWGLHSELGPNSAPLTQISGSTFGRDGFYIHGPSTNPDTYGQESKGCIVIPRDYRLKLIGMAPTTITVIH